MGERIRIINTPPGQAPEWVREKWVGLEMPIAEDAPKSEESFQVGARGGRPENLGGYSICTAEAMAALKEKSSKAAKWWERNLPLELIPWLVFKKDVCEIIPEEKV